MNNFFKIVGILSLICFSFFLTDKTATVVKNLDSVMVSIKNEADKYKIEPINAIINDNNIIPGLNGKKVNINESYKNMRRLGTFNPNMLVYENIKPTISVDNNYDKYIISGNPKKNKVSLLFIVDNINNLNKTIDILYKYNTKAAFFMNSTFFNNNESILDLTKNHTIGIISNSYKNEEFNNIFNRIKKIGKQKYNYCYTEQDNENILNECSKIKVYTIKPSIISDKNLMTIKENIKPGSIISIKVNDDTIKKLPVIINYIKSRGYELDNLINLLDEGI